MPANQLLTNLRMAARLGARQYRDELAHLDLTSRQASLLLAIEANPGGGVRDAAEEIGADLPTCSSLVARLEDRHLIERRADSTDRRRTRLYVVPEARALVRAVRAAHTAAEERIAAAAGAEGDRLAEMLERLIARLQDAPAEVEA